MKLRVLITAILLGAIELVLLAATRPSLSQTAPPGLSQPDLNVELRQALCTQNWERAIQIVDRMKRAAGRQYNSQLTLYRGQLEAIARENTRIPGWTTGCGDASVTPGIPGGEQPIPTPGVTPDIPGGEQPMSPPGMMPQIPGGEQPMPPPGTTEIPQINQPMTNPGF
ncbi:MAG: hypothetical protein ICV63_02660 [Coleofasciculus sp. Co-bin14]|nr:hypothetical protein [Coleofasciculus sp. Co-bin14]